MKVKRMKKTKSAEKRFLFCVIDYKYLTYSAFNLPAFFHRVHLGIGLIQ